RPAPLRPGRAARGPTPREPLTDSRNCTMFNWLRRLVSPPRKSSRPEQRRPRSRWDCPPLVLERLEDRVTPAANVWQGPANGLWSDAANWSLGHTPTTTDTLTFNSTDTNNSVADLAVTVAGVTLTGYTGQVSQNTGATVTIGTGGSFSQDNGT